MGATVAPILFGTLSEHKLTNRYGSTYKLCKKPPSNKDWREGLHVRFGSKADRCNAPTHVRFTPNSDNNCVLRKSRR